MIMLLGVIFFFFMASSVGPKKSNNLQIDVYNLCLLQTNLKREYNQK